MVALRVHLVPAEHRAFNRRRGELDALAFGGKVGGRDAEDDAVEPEVSVLAVCFLRAKSDSHRIAAVFGCGYKYAVIIHGRARKVCRHGKSDIVHAEGESPALELLHDLRRAVIRIKRGFRKFHGQFRSHRLGKGHGIRISLVAACVLRDLGIVKFIKTDCCHNVQSSVS